MHFLQQLDQLSDDNNFYDTQTKNSPASYNSIPHATDPRTYGARNSLFSHKTSHFRPDDLSVIPNHNDPHMSQDIRTVDVTDTTLPANHSVYTEYNVTENSSSNITYYSDATNAAIIPTTVLTDKGRSAFKFHHFNKMQSECFPSLYNMDHNCIISSPTGSGKTVLFELAILRLLNNQKDISNIKILYMAPTKALCLEREKDWASKFGSFGLSVGALTSDTSIAETETVKRAQVIISTPEKWDLMTRKWSDYSKLFGMIKLLLIDEIHILRDNRGSTLEVVVTRMKRICYDIRVIALSATVPNIKDVSSWIKLNSHSDSNALTMVFDDDYRPVKLEKVVYGYRQTTNDFVFDTFLNPRLVQVLNEHSMDKPVLVFCPTRNSTISTAKYLSKNYRTKMALKPSQNFIKDKELAVMVSQGIAYHHAGLSIDDRASVERNFINGSTKILCSTSTLAVGVNLPAYLVVIKGTKIWNIMQFEEYSELDMLQMMGRAGRPQFETEGKCVLMTNINEKTKYESLVKGNERLESKLHLNLPQHLVSEIYLKTITSLEDSLTWLKHTFFYARYQLNPTAYKEIPCIRNADMDSRLKAYSEQTLKVLIDFGIIKIEGDRYQSTAYGDAMVKHYIDFETMKMFLKAKGTQSVSDILLSISKSKEFNTIRLRRNERKLFKILNDSPILRFPLTSDRKGQNFSHGYEKVYLMIQYELGGLEFPSEADVLKLLPSFKQDKFFIFKHVARMARCWADINLEKKDYNSMKNSLLVLRSVCSGCWEDSPVVLKQLGNIGLAAVRKFTNHNIRDFRQMKGMEPEKIEYYGGLRPGIGHNIKEQLNMLPVLSINSRFVKAYKTRGQDKVMVRVSVEVDVRSNSNKWNGKSIYINVLSGLCTGEMIDFRRSYVSKLMGKKSFNLDFEVTSDKSVFECFISCEDIASVNDSSTLRIFENIPGSLSKLLEKAPEIASERVPDMSPVLNTINTIGDFRRYDELEIGEDDVVLDDLLVMASSKKNEKISQPDGESVFLPNGMRLCKHSCKDKTKCRHLCCREGLSPLPPPNSKRGVPIMKKTVAEPKERILQSQSKRSSVHKNSPSKFGTIHNVEIPIQKEEDHSNVSSNLSGYDLLKQLDTNNDNQRPPKEYLSSFKYQEANPMDKRNNEKKTRKRKQEEDKSDEDSDEDIDGVMELLKDVQKRRRITSVKTSATNTQKDFLSVNPIESLQKSDSGYSKISELAKHVNPSLKKHNNLLYGNEADEGNSIQSLNIDESSTTINEGYDNIEEVNHEYQIAKEVENTIQETKGMAYQHSFEEFLNGELDNDDDLNGIFGSDVDII